MKKLALMIAALATIFIAAPSSNADAQTVVIKRGGGEYGGNYRNGPRAQFRNNNRGYRGRGRGRGSKVIVIKKRYRSY